MPGRKWVWLVVAMVPVLLVGGCAAFFAYTANSFLQAPLSNSVASADKRVCPGSQGNNLPLADATKAFHLKIPSGASDVKFSANDDFQGDDSLTLRFTTTKAGLRSFSASDAMPAPVRYPGRQVLESLDLDFSETPCGAVMVYRPHMAYAYDPGYHDVYGQRDLLVNLTDPSHPVVWVEAMDV